MMSISSAALQLHDQDVCRCFSSCTAVDASVAVWIQAECSHSKGGQGIQLHLQLMCACGFGFQSNCHFHSAVAGFKSAIPPDE